MHDQIGIIDARYILAALSYQVCITSEHFYNVGNLQSDWLWPQIKRLPEVLEIRWTKHQNTHVQYCIVFYYFGAESMQCYVAMAHGAGIHLRGNCSTCSTRRLMCARSWASAVSLAAMAAARVALTGICTSRERSSRAPLGPRRSITCTNSFNDENLSIFSLNIFVNFRVV